MPTQLQIRRGTSTEHNSFTGAAGELTVDTTKDTVVVHDGSTAGGFPLARANGSNLSGNLDVGTVTADSLTVDSGTATPIVSLSRSGTYSGITFSQTVSNTTGAGADLVTYSSNNDTGYVWQTTDSGGTQGKALLIAPNRDISFYEDTGVTPKLVWKSSDERLGVGTSAPEGKVSVMGDLHVGLNASVTGRGLVVSTSNTSVTDDTVSIDAQFSTGVLNFKTGGDTALTIKANGEASFANDILLGDAKVARFGNDQDFRISFDGHGIIQNVTSDSDILFKGKDGSTIITALTLDMSQAGAATFSSSVTAASGVFKNTADATGTTIKIQDNADRGITITSPVSGGAAAGRIATSGTANSLEIGVRDYPTALTIAGGSGAATFNGDIITATAGAANFRAGVNAGNSIVSGGNYNTVVGDEAGTAITEGDYNTALGYGALIADTKGARSVALGYRALAGQNFTTATNAFNVGIGHNAGTGILTGVENVLIGGRTGESITTGNYNVIVGNQSDSTAVSSEKAQGFGFSLACAAGYTTIGSGSDDIRAAHGNVTWATVSDERYKKDIADSEAGLSLINALRPRTFKYKTLGELPETFNAFEADSTEVFKNSDTNHGFIAQEVKAAIDADDSIKDGFRLWDDRDDGSQEVAEAALIPVLVKAIQELTARIETLEG